MGGDALMSKFQTPLVAADGNCFFTSIGLLTRIAKLDKDWCRNVASWNGVSFQKFLPQNWVTNSVIGWIFKPLCVSDSSHTFYGSMKSLSQWILDVSYQPESFVWNEEASSWLCDWHSTNEEYCGCFCEKPIDHCGVLQYDTEKIQFSHLSRTFETMTSREFA